MKVHEKQFNLPFNNSDKVRNQRIIKNIEDPDIVQQKKNFILKKIMFNDTYLALCIYYLFKCQTLSEKRDTLAMSKNGIGFSKITVYPGTLIAKHFLKNKDLNNLYTFKSHNWKKRARGIVKIHITQLANNIEHIKLFPRESL